MGIGYLRTAKYLYAFDTCRAAGFHGKNGWFSLLNFFAEPVVTGFETQLHTFAGRAVDAPRLEGMPQILPVKTFRINAGDAAVYRKQAVTGYGISGFAIHIVTACRKPGFQAAG